MTIGADVVHLYYGDGKGKTTAAFGLALRALDAGLPVCVVQFLKDGTSGEARLLAQLPGATVISDGPLAKFSFRMDEAERAASRSLHDKNLGRAIELMKSWGRGLLVLDEAIDALNAGLLDERLLRSAVELGAREGIEVVVTGHRSKGESADSVDGLPAWLASGADYITEMRCVRHPYARGVAARRGIEF